MASTYSASLKIEIIPDGEQSGTWGTTTNANFVNVFEEAIIGRGTVDFPSNANLTVTFTDSVTNQVARNLYLNVTSSVSLTTTRNLVVPTINKTYVIENNTTGGQSIIVKTTAQTGGITVPNGTRVPVYVDGSNVVGAFTSLPIAQGGTGASTVAGAQTSLGINDAAIAFAIALG